MTQKQWSRPFDHGFRGLYSTQINTPPNISRFHSTPTPHRLHPITIYRMQTFDLDFGPPYVQRLKTHPNGFAEKDALVTRASSPRSALTTPVPHPGHRRGGRSAVRPGRLQDLRPSRARVAFTVPFRSVAGWAVENGGGDRRVLASACEV